MTNTAAGVSEPGNRPPSPDRRPSTFESLRYRDFRYLWIGQVGASASQWMEQIARPFLILELTDSAALVGLIAATRMVPQLLLGVWAGVIADRMDKKKLLAVIQAVTLSAHLSTAILILTGLIEPWMVFATTFVAGCSMTFNQPTRQSLIARVVPDEALPNAIALQSSAVNFMRIGGTSLAALVLAVTSFGELYLLQALMYVVVIWFTMKMQVHGDERTRQRKSMLSDLLEGFDAVRKDATIKYILLISMIIFIWGVPYQSVFVPLLADREFGIGSSGGALLVAVVGAGALVGSLTVATIGGSIKRRGRVIIALLITMSIALGVLSQAPSVIIAVPALLVAGASQTSFMAVSNAYVLTKAPREMHGRIMSLFSLDRGLVPLGATIGGFLAAGIGAQSGLLVMASVCLACTLAIALLVPTIRHID